MKMCTIPDSTETDLALVTFLGQKHPQFKGGWSTAPRQGSGAEGLAQESCSGHGTQEVGRREESEREEPFQPRPQDRPFH